MESFQRLKARKKNEMNEQEIKLKLDKLADLRAAHDALTLQKQALIDMVLTDEIKAKLADIESEFLGKHEAINDKANPLEAEIKQAIIQYGASVKGTFLHAVFMKGSVKWDSKSLDGYMVAHPEIASFRKVGEPTCSIRSSR
jgi:ABC-type phosphate transport system auxiliary subunit